MSILVGISKWLFFTVRFENFLKLFTYINDTFSVYDENYYLFQLKLNRSDFEFLYGSYYDSTGQKKDSFLRGVLVATQQKLSDVLKCSGSPKANWCTDKELGQH